MVYISISCSSISLGPSVGLAAAAAAAAAGDDGGSCRDRNIDQVSRPTHTTTHIQMVSVPIDESASRSFALY